MDQNPARHQELPRGNGGKPTSTPWRTWRRRALVLFVSLLFSAIFLELSVRVLVHYGSIAIPPPKAADDGLWDGNHPVFGVWRHPRATAIHETPCFYVKLQTNDVGALDRVRQRQSNERRVVVLGDSFVEGWGLDTEHRVSSRLERATGIEHLNFAMAHFSPYQSYLVYRDLAKSYDHEIVVLGILPLNDFVDLDYEAARGALTYEYRYRPYLVGEYPNYLPYDFREGKIQRFCRGRLYSYAAMDLAWHRLRATPDSGYDRPLKNELGLYQSYYYEFTEKQFNLLRYSLELLLREAHGKRVVVFTIPTLRDFARYRQQPGTSPLDRRLQDFATIHNLQVVDLLPQMFAATDDCQRYFCDGDYHWNEYGNESAADILIRELSGYQVE